MRSLRVIVCLAMILALILLAGVPAQAAPAKPVTERQLLSWIIAEIPLFNLQPELRTRGVNFDLNDSWRASLKQAGVSAQILQVLRKVPPSNAPVPVDECAERLVRVIREVNTKRYEAAQMHMTSLTKANRSDPDLQLALGATLGKQDNWGEAVLAFMEAVRLDPESGFAHELLSYSAYRTGNPDLAIKEAKAAMVLRPNDPDTYKDLGLAYDKRREYEKSAAAFERARRLKPDYPAVFFDIGLSLTNQGRLREAAEAYEKAITLDSTQWRYFYSLGKAYSDQRAWEPAIAAYKRAKDLAPDEPTVRQNLGAVYCNSGRSQEAVNEFQELLALDPDWNMARLCLYKSLMKLGRTEEAKQVKEDYERMGSGGTE